MPFKQIASPEAKYLAATDILIGDMSDINYEFLLYDRPLILLANEWIRENWPDIGLKTDLKNLESAINRSIGNPKEYEDARKEWLHKTIFKPDGGSSSEILDIAIEKSGYTSPKVVILHGNSDVRKTNLLPLYEEAVKRKLVTQLVIFPQRNGDNNTIYFAAHFEDLNIEKGYKVHLDHGLKGKGAANVEMSTNDYKKHDYFPAIDLHITAGEIGNERTRNQLGPNADRAIVGGYPKADHLLKLNTVENRNEIFRELNFDLDKPLITYASAGPYSSAKPGGSFGFDIIEELKRISEINNVNVLVKRKYAKPPIILRAINRLRRKYRNLS